MVDIDMEDAASVPSTIQVELEQRRDVMFHRDAIGSMALCEQTGKLAVVRKCSEEGGSDTIEQYNALVPGCIVYEKVHVASNGGVEAVCWVGGRLVAAHINGSVTICDPHSANMQRRQVCATPIWSACAFDSQLACLVNHSAQLFRLDVADGLVKDSLSLGVDLRLFSVAAHDGVIAIGAMDNVFICKDREVKHKLQVSRSERRLPVVVWSVLFVSPTVVASGDSKGSVSFWNVNNGQLITTVVSHQADVLSLCLSRDGNLLAAGVDPTVVTIAQTSPMQWKTVRSRQGLLRDVRSLVSGFGGAVAVAGGADGWVGDCESGKTVVEMSTSDERDVRVSVCALAVRGTDCVDLWTVGPPPMAEAGGKIICRVHTPAKAPLVAFDLSADGGLLVLSTAAGTTSYRLQLKKRKKPVLKTPMTAPPATAVKISNDGSSVLLAVEDFRVVRVPAEGGEEKVLIEELSCGEVVRLCVSPCEQHAAVVTTRADIYALDLGKAAIRQIKRKQPPLDVAFAAGHLYCLYGQLERNSNAPIITQHTMLGEACKGGCPVQQQLGRQAAVAIQAGPAHTLLVHRNNGRWTLMHKAGDGQFELNAGRGASSADQEHTSVVVSGDKICEITRFFPTPSTAPYKLKKFGEN